MTVVRPAAGDRVMAARKAKRRASANVRVHWRAAFMCHIVLGSACVWSLNKIVHRPSNAAPEEAARTVLPDNSVRSDGCNTRHRTMVQAGCGGTDGHHSRCGIRLNADG